MRTLNDWTQRMGLPRLGGYGIQESDTPRIVANCSGSSMKTNLVELTDAEVRQVLMARLKPILDEFLKSYAVTDLYRILALSRLYRLPG